MKNKHLVVIPVFNELKTTQKMLRSYVKNTDLKKCKTIIVDDKSEQQTKNFLRKFVKENSTIVLEENKKNLGKPKSINNIFFKHKEFDYFTIIDSDINILTKNWQDRMLKAHKTWQNKSIIGAKLHLAGYEFIKSGLIFGDLFPFWTLPGGFFSIPKYVFVKIGYFYDKIHRHEDAEYCRRAATQNIRWYYLSGIKVKILKRKSFSEDLVYQKIKQKEIEIYKKRAEYIMKSHDVFYNPF